MILKLFSSLIIGCFCVSTVLVHASGHKKLTKSVSVDNLKKPASEHKKLTKSASVDNLKKPASEHKKLIKSASVDNLKKPASLVKTADLPLISNCWIGTYTPHKFRQDGKNFYLLKGIPDIYISPVIDLLMLKKEEAVDTLINHFTASLSGKLSDLVKSLRKLRDELAKDPKNEPVVKELDEILSVYENPKNTSVLAWRDLLILIKNLEKLKKAIQQKYNIMKIKLLNKRKKNMAHVLYGQKEFYQYIEISKLGNSGSCNVNAEQEVYQLDMAIQRLKNVQTRYGK